MADDHATDSRVACHHAALPDIDATRLAHDIEWLVVAHATRATIDGAVDGVRAVEFRCGYAHPVT